MPSSREPFFSNWPKQRIDAFFLLLTLFLGSIQVYACRFELDPDSMDYLDIARELSRGHWSAIANGYWGTLNSVFLAPLFWMHPSISNQIPLAHFEQLIILFAAFLAFRYFLNSYSSSLTVSDHGSSALPDSSLRLFGYALFLWSSLVLVPVKSIGADLLVTVFLYLAAGLLVRLQSDSPILRFALFGFVLGIGYWAKAIMFPVALVFLAVAALKTRRWKQMAVAAALFALVAAPLLLALSRSHGRFTFGDSGTINYSSLVSPGGRVINWQGQPNGSGHPVHPTRVLPGTPPIYEFNGPLTGTYPPSYDPSYWNEGRKSTLSISAQLRVIAMHTPRVVEMLFISQASVTAGFLFLFLWNPQGYWRRLLERWDVIAVAAAIIGLYMLVNFETRFVGAFAVFLWMSAFLAARVPNGPASQRAGAMSIVAVACVVLLTLASTLAKTISSHCPESAQPDIALAQQLQIPAGTPIAFIGQSNYAYWAYLAQLRIVAEVMAPDTPAFWRLPSSEREQRYADFRRTGARYLFAQPPENPSGGLEAGWQRIGDTSYFEYSLR